MNETHKVIESSSVSLDNDKNGSPPEEELILHYQIACILAKPISMDTAITQVLQMICEAFQRDFGALWQMEADNHTFTNVAVWHADCADLSGYAETFHHSSLDLNETRINALDWTSNRLIWLSNLTDFQPKLKRETKKAGLKSGFVLPILSRGKLIAILECLSKDNRSQDQKLFGSLNMVGIQIGKYLELKVLEETLALQSTQQSMLGEIGITLSASLDLQERLKNFLKATVPALADWCAIDLIEKQSVLRRVAVAHRNPEKLDLVYALQPTRTIDLREKNRPQVMTLFSKQSLLFRDISSSESEKWTIDPELTEITYKLKAKSCIVVPLVANDEILGICTFVMAESDRHYSSKDLVLAEDLGQRLSLAVHNAVLYAESLKYNADIEQRLEDRSSELRLVISRLSEQIIERKIAEEQVNQVNANLNERIEERTSQLEIANRKLHTQVLEYEQVSQDLRISLKRTHELYRISQAIGIVHNPCEVLSVLLSNSYLQDAGRASVAILDEPWLKDAPPPTHCTILAEWNRSVGRPTFIDRRLRLTEYGIIPPVPYAQPIVIPDIKSLNKLPKSARERFIDLQTKSLIILPLIANNEWYGLLSLHFSKLRMPNLEDLGHIRGLVDETAIVIQNIRLLEAEKNARHEAEVANELKLKFLAMISHELRTPLASIKGFATTLLADDVIWPPETQRDFLQTIDSESDKLSDLVEQLLDLSRMEAGILQILPKRLSLYQIVNSALSQIQAISLDHQLKLDISPELPYIFGDELRIAQVLTNLIGNAAKFSPPKSLITVSGHLTGAMIQVDVSDHGVGISQMERNRIFEAFYQIKTGNGRLERGAGLGLAICKGLIEAQGGTIWLQDRTSPGTVISFTLPISSGKDGIVTGK